MPSVESHRAQDLVGDAVRVGAARKFDRHRAVVTAVQAAPQA